jgi:predicted nucleotidyltransferase
MNKDIISYAEHFSSFLLQNASESAFRNIKEIILFGSVSRGEAAKASDVDIFVDVLKEDKNTEREVSTAVKRFYETEIFRKYWKLLGIENEIKCIVGKLEKWKDLEQSIVADGLILYGKYGGPIKGKTSLLVYWGKVKPDSKRVFLSKKLYGYTYKKKEYMGILEGTESLKLSSNCLLVPLENSKPVLHVFKELGIRPRTIYMSRFR